MKEKKIEECALQLKDIVKVYGENENQVKALKGINLSFRKNEFVSILGPSGCGKTTLLNIIGGLDRYTSGDLIIDGISTKEYKDSDWDTYRNNSIGFIFQSYNLIPHQTVLSNVELALTLSGVSKSERRKRAEAVLKQVGLEGMENKLPNQMSGGQMQRVAIARALVNDPEIILADEPTGALDTETSIQVLDLLKEVAKDRLVIMVTHNPELAKNYSTRIINFLDGEKTGDTNPFTENGKVVEKAKKGKSSMRFITALSLSLSNLRTKKGRTILTAIAGSIGIIGIALVLAVSTGFSTYINKLQADTLSVYPVTINESTIDLSDFEKLTNKVITDDLLKQRIEQKVFTKKMFGDITTMLKSNNLSQEYTKKDGTKIKYLDYVKNKIAEENEKALNTDNKWKYCLQTSYGFDVNDYIFSNIGYNFAPVVSGVEPTLTYNVMAIDSLVKTIEGMFQPMLDASNMKISADFVRQYIPTVCEMPDNLDLLKSQYELLGDNSKWASKEDELMVVVDKYNRISDITLALLGYKTIKGINMATNEVTFGGEDQIPFEEVLGKKFYFIANDDRYVPSGTAHTYNAKPFTEATLPENKLELKVTGVLRLKEDVKQGILQSGIAYTSKLPQYIMEKNKDSVVVNDAKTGYIYEGKEIHTITVNSGAKPLSYNARTLGGDNTISKLSVYSIDYKAKEEIKKYLDAWNTDIVYYDETLTGEALEKAKEDAEASKVHYSDSTETLFSAMNSIVDAVKIVLICFTSISLVVSSIMIGIITYVSVVERTKEIGILRAVGARKRDISRIFNAETFLIGLFAGLIGVVVTYLLTIPINLIISGLIANAGNIASLKVVHALILVVVSFALTLIAGIIPARIAAKKDPVVALRSE